MVCDIQSDRSIAVSSRRPVARRLNNANSLKESNNGRLEIIKASLAKRVVGGELREQAAKKARAKKPTERPHWMAGEGEGSEAGYRTTRRDQSLLYRLYRVGRL